MTFQKAIEYANKGAKIGRTGWGNSSIQWANNLNCFIETNTTECTTHKITCIEENANDWWVEIRLYE
jgi:hypothetical protein